MIHPTAVIDPDAQLGQEVVVGPYTVIGPKVTIGDRCRIESHVQIESHVRMGSGSSVSSFASLGAPPQDIKYKGEDTWVEIGEGAMIREYVTVNRATPHGTGVTRVGNGAMLMAYCHVAHDCRIGNKVVIANGTMLAGHVEIGESAVIGGMVGVHQFVRIGEYAMVGGMSAAAQDIPPFVIAAVGRERKGSSLFGLNLIGLRRNRFSAEAISALKKAYQILFRSGAPMGEAVSRVEAEVELLPEVKRLLEFIRASKRGVTR